MKSGAYKRIIVICRWVTALICQIQSQNTDAVSKESLEAILDSADYYELRNPGRALALSLEVLKSYPEVGYEKEYIRALMNCANTQKLMGNAPEANSFCDKAIQIAQKLRDTDLQIEVYFMKATVFTATDREDSAVVYFHKV